MSYDFDGTDDFMSYDELQGLSIIEGEGDFQLGGHDIIHSDDFMYFECNYCDKSQEVPDIFRQSTPGNRILYQLYILGLFKKHECSEQPIGELQPPDGNPITDKHTPPGNPKPGDVYWQGGDTYTMKMEDGHIVTDGKVVLHSDSDYADVGDYLGETKSMAFQRKLTDAAKLQQAGGGAVNHQMGGPTTTNIGDVNVTMSDKAAEDLKKQLSAREKYARKML